MFGQRKAPPEESESLFTAHSTAVVINVLQVDSRLVALLLRERTCRPVRAAISTSPSFSIILLLVFPENQPMKMNQI